MWTQRWFVSQEGPDFLVFQTPLPHFLDCTLLNSLRFLFILFNTISFSFPCFSLTFSSISIFLPHFSFFLLCFHFLSKAFSFLLPFNPCVYQVGRDPWLTSALFSFWRVWGCTESDTTEAQSLQLYPTLRNPMEHQAPLSRRFSRQEYWSGLLFSSSRGSSWPRVGTCTSCRSCIAGRFFTHWAIWEVHFPSRDPSSCPIIHSVTLLWQFIISFMSLKTVPPSYSRKMLAGREWQDILRVMKENNLQPRLLYPARISFRYEGELRSFTDKQKLREFSTTKPALQQMLKDLL